LAGNGKTAEVPAPPAEESRDIDYDQLYSQTFQKPSSYIRFSQTVEECTGCRYDMSTEDDAFLRSYNENRPVGSHCSEDAFETIMEVFEATAGEETPFAAVDNTVVPYEVMESPLKQRTSQKLLVFAKDMFDHWRTRRQASGNRSLQPSLKFETHQENDDGDPYVCFRRRDVRQTRKTRARDVQSTDKLRRLRKELEEGRQLVVIANQRELCKRELLAVDRAIFEQRAKVKEAKMRLGIENDDGDLINQRPQKKRPAETPQMQRPPGGQLRLPTRPDGRPIEVDLRMLSDELAQKENLLQAEINLKVQQHRRWNESHVDLTRAPLSPIDEQGAKSGFRLATAQYLLTPPASVTSETSGDHPSPTQEKEIAVPFRYASPIDEVENHGQPAYRQRIGRLGRLWIDRRGMPAAAREMDNSTRDRWKYDQDDDDEQPVYEMDPYDTKAMKFRATIPFPPHLLHRRPQQIEPPVANAQGSNGTAGSPPNRPASSSNQRQQPPP